MLIHARPFGVNQLASRRIISQSEAERQSRFGDGFNCRMLWFGASLTVIVSGALTESIAKGRKREDGFVRGF
jgi:hypothetical protein